MNQIKIYFSRLNTFFNRKENLLIFLILLIGVSVPAFSGLMHNNFYYRLQSILTSPIFNVMCFCALGLNVIFLKKELANNANIVIRYQTYSKMIQKNEKDICVFSVYICLIAVILSIAGAIVSCFGDYSFFIQASYQIPMLFCIIVAIIRFIVFQTILQVILYLISIRLNDFCAAIVILIQCVLVGVLQIPKPIEHFYNLPLLPYYYFRNLTYTSFWLEILCFILYTIFLVGIWKIIEYWVSRKKQDFS